MCNLSEAIFEDGELSAKKASTLRMLKKGYDYETIMEILDVTMEQIKEWEQELKQDENV